jgi:hypothetical protein
MQTAYVQPAQQAAAPAPKRFWSEQYQTWVTVGNSNH